MVSLKSTAHANLGELDGKGVVQIGRTSVERLATSFWGGGCMASSGASSLHDFFDYQGRVLELRLFPRTSRLSFVFKFTAAFISLYVIA